MRPAGEEGEGAGAEGTSTWASAGGTGCDATLDGLDGAGADTAPGTRSGGEATMTAAAGAAAGPTGTDGGGASMMRGVCCPAAVTAGTVTSF